MKKLLEILGSAAVFTSVNLGAQPAEAFVPSQPTQPGGNQVDNLMQEVQRQGIPRPELECGGLINARAQVRSVGDEMVQAFNDAANNKQITGYIAYEEAAITNEGLRVLTGGKPPETIDEHLRAIRNNNLLAQQIEPNVVKTFKDTARLLKSGPEIFDKAAFQPIESYLGGCPGDREYQAKAPEKTQSVASVPPALGRKP